ncbi:secretin and TonB N-terminal domain-containing protein [Planctomycetota bacterium]
MKNSILKSQKVKYLLIPAFIAVTCAAAFAAGTGEVSGSKEVLTTLEQRMQKRITVDFRSTAIDDVLRIMAEQADVDIVKSPKVEGSVTASLTDVPLQEALNNILAAHGYGYTLSKNMIRVAPIGEITNETAERVVNKIYRITYADVAEVESALTKFISKRGYISSNAGTSNIIVTDIESKIKSIDKFIEEIDRITPQILVEARIYDITSKDKLDLGIEWNAGRNTDYGTSGVGGIGVNPDIRTDPFLTGVFSGATGKTSGTAGVLRFGWLNAGIDIDMVLKAQQNKINAKLLANPRVLVLDNHTANFKIISELPYQVLTESAYGGSIGTTSFKEVGVELNVIPHLTRDGMIKLQVQPMFSVKVDEVTFAGTGTISYPQPVVDRREANTTLLVKNGQTVVLGGLRKKDVTRQVNKVPILGDIPLVGLLFRFEGEDTITSEMVVFITPHIATTPVLSEREQQAYDQTNFSGPEVDFTRAEKESEQ